VGEEPCSGGLEDDAAALAEAERLGGTVEVENREEDQVERGAENDMAGVVGPWNLGAYGAADLVVGSREA
jgi:hypothetical protein